ncbi:DUF1345 domain-containing protein [Brevundimonas sp.]|uniref:DUF1345 domain-containing protein n=1 Tax=Brevundimonas sp. TaxID=1871086 RepID=UPI002FC8B340
MTIAPRIVRLHVALWLGLAVMASVLAIEPASWNWPARLAVAWDSGVAAFLLLTLFRMTRARTISDIHARASEMDQAGSGVLPLSLLAAAASVFVIVYMAASGGKPTAFDAILTIATIALSWLFVQVIFTLHYTHEFYAPDTSGPATSGPDGTRDRKGLIFPSEEEASYWDFLHFALIIGVANQTADVQISTARMRRIATVHSLLSWLFNTVILALAVNLAINLL